MSDLKSRLSACAEQWSAAHDAAPLSRLGKIVAGDANFFSRIAAPTSSLNIKTLEKFAAFLGDPVHWPNSLVPAEVEAFVQRVEGRPCIHPSPDAAEHQDRSTGQIADGSTVATKVHS